MHGKHWGVANDETLFIKGGGIWKKKFNEQNIITENTDSVNLKDEAPSFSKVKCD